MPSKMRTAGKRPPDAMFLDANIVMYAIGTEHPLREPCRRALDLAVTQRTPLITDAEVLQEVLYRYFSIRRPEVAKVAYQAVIRLCHETLSITETHTSRALALLLQRPGLSPRDAIHVATMESAGIRRILSTDSHFDALNEVERTGPVEFCEHAH